MRFDFEMGIAFGEALQRLKVVSCRVSKVELRVDRLELVMRGLLLAALSAASAATNMLPEQIADALLVAFHALKG